MASHWLHVQYEELKGDNELFKQELQTRETTIHALRHELQDMDNVVHHMKEQYDEQNRRLTEQWQNACTRSDLLEQDYCRLKRDYTSHEDEWHRQKQIYQEQSIERDRDLERLRLQLTTKALYHVNDEELERRCQTLTESILNKQTTIESLQMENSSLRMQLERLETRLDEYDTINMRTSQSSLFTSKLPSIMTIAIDENELVDNLRHRSPLLRETPFDVHLTKQVKRAANELDHMTMRLTMLLRRYPIVRLAALFYVILLHLWTFIVLCTYTPEIHDRTNSINLKR
jgi:chromosome segregation ATPase